MPPIQNTSTGPPAPQPASLFDIGIIVQVVLQAAEARDRSEAEAGNHHGSLSAGQLREAVKYFMLGVRREIPAEWKRMLDPQDPEYAEYQRLHAKFGGVVPR